MSIGMPGSACGRSTPSPAAPSVASSFLTGTWRGTVTLEVNPGDPNALPPSSGAIEWTFEAISQTNLEVALRKNLMRNQAFTDGA
jgi:hypothetical protein